LQNQTLSYGPGLSRFNFSAKQNLAKHVPLGDLIVLDRERCIQCGRCIRFQDEIADDPVLRFEERGRKLQIITFSDPPFDSYFGGNTTDICPVGALTTRDFRFEARPWELHHNTSICNHCPVGCNLVLDTRVEATHGNWVIKRVMPRQNEKVNEIWICDKGRYGHHHARSVDRLTTPLLRRNGELVEASWDEAVKQIVKRIKSLSPAQIAGVAGDRLSNEDLFLFQALLREVIGTPHLDTYPHAPGVDLIAQYGIGADSDWRDLNEDSVILVVAGDVEEQAPIWFLRIKAAVQAGAKLVVVNGRPTKLDRYTNHNLQIRYGSAPHLLLGLARLLLQENAQDHARFKKNLSGLEPEAIERFTGIPPAELQTVAETLAQAENVIVVFGREGLNDFAAQALVQSAANLLLATGHVGRANNGLLPLWPHNNTQGAADMGMRPNAGPGYQEIVEHGSDLDDMLRAIESQKINFMWLAGADPANDNPAIAESLKKLDFLVVQELFLTKTAEQANVVLPALSFAERAGTYTSADRRVQWFNRALPPLGRGRADWAIFTDVANRLDADWDFRASADVLEAINQAVPQYGPMTLSALRATKPQWPPVGGDSLYFGGTAYKNRGGLGLRWRAGAEAEGTEKAFGWVELSTLQEGDLVAVPVRWLYRPGTLISHSQVLEGQLRDPAAELNPRDAQRLGLEEGTSITAGLSGQTVDLIVRLNKDIPEGVVLVPSHLPPGPVTIKAVATAAV
jgi:NADH-quinone oxidoreductase subunit G